MFSIPAKSQDLNPIENIFHLVRKKLKSDALRKKITRESYNEFCKRVGKILKEFPVSIINKTIDSIEHRLKWPSNKKVREQNINIDRVYILYSGLYLLFVHVTNMSCHTNVMSHK